MDIRYGQKRSSIKRTLKKKIEEWIESITDETLQKAVKRDTIVTGGSICSMLMGYPVNDYDVYFRTLETTKAVAEYYVKVFNANIRKEHKSDVIMHEPFVKVENFLEEDRVLIYIKSAGVASENQEQYKYFEQYDGSKTEAFVESLAEEVKKKEKYRPIFLSQNAVTLSDDLQVVTRFYGEPAQIHNNYDFVHATCYYEYHNENLVLAPKALEVMLSHTLLYHGSLYPIASIFRAKKFIERGWRITAGQLLKIMWQINELDLKNPIVLREQLTGVDQAYMYQLLAALKDVDPEKINSAYIAAIIDKIFE